MLLEFFRKRKAIGQQSVCFYDNGKGGTGASVILPINVPTEVSDKFGYKILGSNSDIVRKVEPKKADPGIETKKKSKKTKVVEQYTTA